MWLGASIVVAYLGWLRSINVLSLNYKPLGESFAESMLADMRRRRFRCGWFLSDLRGLGLPKQRCCCKKQQDVWASDLDHRV